MADLTIDLREGFRHTPTVVRVDGVEVYSNPDLSTRMQIGLAAQVRTTAQAERFQLQIELSHGAQRAERSLSLAQGCFVGVDVTRGGEIAITQSVSPFGYV